MANTSTAGATRTFQGQTVPAESVKPAAFFQNTRRKRSREYGGVFAGLGQTDTAELKKSDILATIHVRFSGTLTVTHNAGTVAATFRWPYDLIKAVRFTANGQSNLVNCSGLKLKAREMFANPEADDRGVAQSVSGATVTQGTLAQASESWGVGPGQAAIATGNYPVELYWKVPVAEDEKDLSGAVFLQTSAMDLNLFIDWNTAATLFTITGNDTVVLTGNVIVETEKYSIPVSGGNFVVPDLSLYHSLVQSQTSSLAQGDNEARIIGQGVGKQMLRCYFQVWNGATSVPLAATAANFGPQGWRYGTNETPEVFPDGRSLRQWNESLYGSDVGAVWGFLAHEFEATWGFRDAVDMGQTSDLRLYLNIVAALTNPVLEYVTETMFAAGSAA